MLWWIGDDACLTNEIFNLNKIIDLEKWQSVQDSIAKATKMAIITVDYRGRPVTRHSCCHPFCQAVRSDPELSSYCQKCDARGGLEAVRQNAPYIYYCHYGIVDIAVPITVAEKYVGAVMIGQVKLKGGEGSHLEKIVHLPEAIRQRNWDSIQEKYMQIPILSYGEVNVIAEMLFHLSNYIVEEALNKNLLIEMYQKSLRGDQLSDFTAVFSGYQAQNLEQARKVMSSSLLDKQLHDVAETEKCSNPILQPVLSHIHQHKGENLPLRQAAELCHLSPSYFSRLFAREMGENYSAFLSHIKVNWSKKLLVETDMSISQISDELGFSEPGYFIKTFKRFEGTTPSLYRKYYTKT